MPFSSRRLDDSFPGGEEVGLYYTRDKYGQLQVPPGYEFSTKENTKNYLIDKEPKAATCSLKVQNGKTSPTSLFSICLDFVAKNITMVESLCGFPEIVGKELFKRVQINGGFPKGCQQNLQLFCDAYESLVLSKLSLKNRYLEVNEVNYLQCYPYLTELDLSHCLLGSDHELLAHVAKVTSLLKLNLKDNGLKDSDLKNFTLPLRVMGAGPLHLSILDLSCNPGISDLSVRYLTTFSQLTALNLSGTSITMGRGVARLTKETNLKLSPSSTEFKAENAIKTEGWASSVIDDWLSNSNTVLKSKRHNTENEKTNPFYVKKAKSNILKCKRVVKTREATETHIILTVVKRTMERNLDGNSVENKKTKFTNKSLNMANAASSATKRKSTSSNQEDEESDDDMMESYMKSNVKVDNKKRKICLADLAF